jgi:hypothetical protein
MSPGLIGGLVVSQIGPVLRDQGDVIQHGQVGAQRHVRRNKSDLVSGDRTLPADRAQRS